MLKLFKNSYPTIGAFYQCYKQPKALINTLRHFRNIYPESTLVLVSNNGDDVGNVAKYFNCNYTHSTESTSDFSVYCKDEAAVKLYVSRIYKAAQIIKEDYILLLADDVHVFKPITNLNYDLNGGEGYWRGRLKLKLKDLLNFGDKIVYSKYDNLRAGGDGFIMKKDFILKHFGNIDLPLNELAPFIKSKYNNMFPSDACINMLTIYYGGTVGPYLGWYERTRLWYYLRRLLNSIEVSHQEKIYYNKPLTKEEEDIYNGNY